MARDLLTTRVSKRSQVFCNEFQSFLVAAIGDLSQSSEFPCGCWVAPKKSSSSYEDHFRGQFLQLNAPAARHSVVFDDVVSPPVCY